MSNDAARKLGARCHMCPLDGCAPVLAAGPTTGGTFAVVTDYPEDRDVENGLPLLDDGGREFTFALDTYNIRRSSLRITHAVACQPLGGRMDSFLAALRARNRGRKALGQPTIPSPIECCADRLLAEIKEYPNVLALGSTSLSALVPGNLKALESRGQQFDGKHGKRVFATLSGKFVKQKRRWRPIFQGDIARAFRFFTGAAEYVRPTFTMATHASQMPLIRQFFADARVQGKLGLTTDVETRASVWQEDQATTDARSAALDAHDDVTWEPFDEADGDGSNREDVFGVDPLGMKPQFDPRLDRLNMIGFRLPDGRTLSIMRRSVEDDRRLVFFDGPGEWEAVWQEIADVIEDPTILLIGHNSDYYDFTVFDSENRRILGRPLVFQRSTDTLLVHHLVEPELPHNLLFVGTTTCDVHNWKAGRHALESDSDWNLADYNAIDLDVTFRAAKALIPRLRKLELVTAYRSDAKMQAIARGMHRNGMPISQRVRRVWDMTLRETEEQWTYNGRVLSHCAACGGTEASHPTAECSAFDPHSHGVYSAIEALNALRSADPDIDPEQATVDPWAFNPKKKGDARALNIRSREQVGRLLFDWLQLPEPEDLSKKDIYTESDERSTSDTVLQAYIVDPNTTHAIRALIHALRMARRARKLWGTYCATIAPWSPLLTAAEAQEIPAPRDAPRDDVALFRPARNVLWEDGWVHPDWQAGRTPVGRYASSKPNGQNWPPFEHLSLGLWDVYPEWQEYEENGAKKKSPPLTIKDTVAAPPGYRFVGIDVDAIHLRIIGSKEIWNVASLQEAFEGKRKWRGRTLGPHEIFAIILFGDLFLGAKGWPEGPNGSWKGEAKTMRQVAKIVRYAGAYKAGVSTIARELVATEDKKTGTLIFAKRYGGRAGRQRVQDLLDTWMNAEPEWEAAWAATLEEWRECGGIRDPILGRIMPCRDENENEIINSKILTIEGSVMHHITQDFVDAVPFEYAGPGTGLINQCHDSLTALVPEQDALRVAGVMNEVMNRKFPQLSVPIKGKAAIGRTWQQV